MGTETRQMDPGTWINNMLGTSDAYNPYIDNQGLDKSNVAAQLGAAYRSSPYYTGSGQFLGDPTAFAQNYTGTTNALDAFKKLQGMGNLPGLSSNFGTLDPNTGMLNQTNITGGGDLGEFLGPLGVMAGAAGIGGLMGGAFGGLGGAAAGGTGAFDMGGMGAELGSSLGAGVGGATGATGMDINSILNPSSFSDPFGLSSTPEFQYGNLSGINPGDFTSSMIPGGDLSATAGGMANLGGVGGVAGVDAAGAQSLLGPLTQKIGTSAAQSLIGKIIGGTATSSDYGTLLGQLGGAALSYLGGQKQASQLNSLAQQNMAFGAPSRARFEASMTPGFDPSSIPGYTGAVDTASKSLLARLSATGGNPFGNPGGMIEANKAIINGTALPAIQNYQNENLNAGYGAGFGASNTAATGAINANAGSLTGAAGALGQLTTPDNSIATLLQQLKGFQSNNGGGLA